MNVQDFLNRLSVLLAERNWTKKRLAIEAEINANTLQGYWSQKRFPKGDDLIKIADVLGTTAEYLVTGSHPPFHPSNPLVHGIISYIERFSKDELIEIRGVIRSYAMNFFRKTAHSDTSATIAADKKEEY